MAENLKSGGAEGIDDTDSQGGFRPDDGQIDLIVLGESQKGGLRLRASTIACSRPPPPITRTVLPRQLSNLISLPPMEAFCEGSG